MAQRETGSENKDQPDGGIPGASFSWWVLINEPHPISTTNCLLIGQELNIYRQSVNTKQESMKCIKYKNVLRLDKKICEHDKK